MEQQIEKVLHDRYKVQSLLGRQTGRRTILATDLQTGLPVIIKLLLFTADFNWDDLKLFEREAEVLRSLDHPAISRYLDHFEVETELGKGFALVQTYIEARSLQNWIQAGRTFSEPELKAIAKELLGILDYLHCRQPSVIHRDIKPSNILLSDRSGNRPGKVYLIDFGSVQTVIGHGTRTIVGTYGYMPPEQFGGRTEPASDLYALGATLIYLATGQPPDQFPQREMRILFDDQVHLSHSLIEWLKGLTEPSLDLRLKAAKQALTALETSSLRKSGSFVKLGKPARSKIQVIQTGQEVEIMIPPRGFHFGLIYLIGVALFWNSFVIPLYIVALATWTSGGWVMALFLTGLLYAGLSMIWGILFTLFGRTRLWITESEIVRTAEMFGLRSPMVAARKTITKIEVTRRTYRTNPEAGYVAVPPQINIWAGTEKFTLGNEDSSTYPLTSPERDWLAQVLSNYLNLPITED